MKFYSIKWVAIYLVSMLLMSAACGKTDGGEKAAPKPSPKETRNGSEAGVVNFDALMKASLQGDLETVRNGLEQGAPLNKADSGGRTLLMMAAYNGHTELVQYLLGEGADIKSKNTEGRTALMFAASGNFPETVELLLQKGAEIDARDGVEGWTPLMFAAAGGHADVVRVLLDHGADPTIKDKDDESAYNFAESNGHTEAAKLLEAAGTNN